MKLILRIDIDASEYYKNEENESWKMQSYKIFKML